MVHLMSSPAMQDMFPGASMAGLPPPGGAGGPGGGGEQACVQLTRPIHGAVITGVQSQSQLNGESGTITEWWPANGRFTLLMQQQQQQQQQQQHSGGREDNTTTTCKKKLKAVNVVLPRGTIVKVSGGSARGCIARVESSVSREQAVAGVVDSRVVVLASRSPEQICSSLLDAAGDDSWGASEDGPCGNVALTDMTPLSIT